MPTMHTIEEHEAQQVKPYIDASIQNIANLRAEMGAHNLLPFPYRDGNIKTSNKATFTVNSDQSITINTDGATTGSAWFDLTAMYAIDGGSSNWSITSGYSALGNKYIGSIGIDTAVDGLSMGYTASSQQMWLLVSSGKTINNVTIHPNIWDKDDLDHSSKPYAMTNQQLTQETTGLIDNMEVNGAVNMLPTDIATQALKGATITHNSDGSYSVIKSTADSQSGSILSTAFTLKAGTYYWSASQNGHSAIGDNNCYCFIKGINGTGDWYRSTDFDVNHKWGVITLTQDSSIQFGIVVGTDASNITFYPMITVASYDGDYVPYAKSNRELTEDTTAISGTITNATGIVNANANAIYKVGNLVVWNMFVKATAAISNGAAICTLPYKPTTRIHFQAAKNYTTPLLLKVETTGVVTLSAGTLAIDDTLIATLAFETND